MCRKKKRKKVMLFLQLIIKKINKIYMKEKNKKKSNVIFIIQNHII